MYPLGTSFFNNDSEKQLNDNEPFHFFNSNESLCNLFVAFDFAAKAVLKIS